MTQAQRPGARARHRAMRLSEARLGQKKAVGGPCGRGGAAAGSRHPRLQGAGPGTADTPHSVPSERAGLGGAHKHTGRREGLLSRGPRRRDGFGKSSRSRHSSERAGLEAEEEGPGVKEDLVLLVDLRRVGQWRGWKGLLNSVAVASRWRSEGAHGAVSSAMRSTSRQQPAGAWSEAATSLEDSSDDDVSTCTYSWAVACALAGARPQADRALSPQSRVPAEVLPCFTKEGPGLETRSPSLGAHSQPGRPREGNVQTCPRRGSAVTSGRSRQAGAASWPGVQPGWA